LLFEVFSFRGLLGKNFTENRIIQTLLIEIFEVFAAAVTQPDKNDRNKQD
jgi:hypothetical protein